MEKPSDAKPEGDDGDKDAAPIGQQPEAAKNAVALMPQMPDGWNMAMANGQFVNGFGFDASGMPFAGMDWTGAFNPMMMQNGMTAGWNGFPNMMSMCFVRAALKVCVSCPVVAKRPKIGVSLVGGQGNSVQYEMGTNLSSVLSNKDRWSDGQGQQPPFVAHGFFVCPQLLLFRQLLRGLYVYMCVCGRCA